MKGVEEIDGVFLEDFFVVFFFIVMVNLFGKIYCGYKYMFGFNIF